MKRNDFIRQIQQRLISRRNALRRNLTGDASALSSSHDEGVGDEIDATIISEHAEIESQIADFESRELGKIDAALERFRSGRYGRCEQCGKAIKMARLQAVPYAVDCIDCARALERSGGDQHARWSWGQLSALPAPAKDVSLSDMEHEIDAG